MSAKLISLETVLTNRGFSELYRGLSELFNENLKISTILYVKLALKTQKDGCDGCKYSETA